MEHEHRSLERKQGDYIFDPSPVTTLLPINILSLVAVDYTCTSVDVPTPVFSSRQADPMNIHWNKTERV